MGKGLERKPESGPKGLEKGEEEKGVCGKRKEKESRKAAEERSRELPREAQLSCCS